MTWVAIAAGVLVFLAVLLLALGLCRIAALGDAWEDQ
jgi:hypothetical protein